MHVRANSPDQRIVTEGVIRLGSRELFVRRVGQDQPPLLLINGLGLPLDMWARLEPQLTGSTLVEVDLPGSGRSAGARAPLTMYSYARLLTQLLDILDVPTADVLGLSFGGMVAQQLAVDAPGRVRKLILASTSCGWGSLPTNPLSWTASALEAHPARSSRPGEATVPTGQASDALWGDESNAGRLPKARGYLHQVLAASTWTSLPWLAGVRQETLVIAGTADALVPAANAAQLPALLPNARSHLIEGGGHLCVLDHAGQAGSLIAAFLAA